MRLPWQRGLAAKSDTADMLVSDLTSGFIPQPLTQDEFDLLLRMVEIGDEVLTAENYQTFDTTPIEDDLYRSLRFKLMEKLMAGTLQGGDIDFNTTEIYSYHSVYTIEGFEAVYQASVTQGQPNRYPYYAEWRNYWPPAPRPDGFWLYSSITQADMLKSLEQITDPIQTPNENKRKKVIDQIKDRDGDGQPDPPPPPPPPDQNKPAPPGPYDPAPPPPGPKESGGDDNGGTWESSGNGDGTHNVAACLPTALILHRQTTGRGVADVVAGVQYIPYSATVEVAELIIQAIEKAENLLRSDFDIISLKLAFDGVATLEAGGSFGGASISLPLGFINIMPKITVFNPGTGVSVETAFTATEDKEIEFSIAGNGLKFKFRLWNWAETSIGSDVSPIGTPTDFFASFSYSLVAAPIGFQYLNNILGLRANAYQLALQCYKIKKNCNARLPFRYNFEQWDTNRDCWSDGRPGPITTIAGLQCAQTDRFGSVRRVGVILGNLYTGSVTVRARHCGEGGIGGAIILRDAGDQPVAAWHFNGFNAVNGWTVAVGTLSTPDELLDINTGFTLTFSSDFGLNLFYVSEFEIVGN